MDYKIPDINLLSCHSPHDTNLKYEVEIIQRILIVNGISADIVNAHAYSRSDLFEIRPYPRERVKRIISRKAEISQALKNKSIDFIIPIPGTSHIGLRVCKENNTGISIREGIVAIIEDSLNNRLPYCAGYDYYDRAIVKYLDEDEHILVSGTTGSGKSSFLHSMMLGFLYRYNPDELKVIMMDAGGIEFPFYRFLPHLQMPVITDVGKAFSAILWMLEEAERRHQRLDDYSARSIGQYNEEIKHREADVSHETMPHIVLLIDEFADIVSEMDKSEKDAVYEKLMRLLRIGSSVGIHAVFATRQPLSSILPEQLKSMIPTHICFFFSDQKDSKWVLGTDGAERLHPQGELLYVSKNNRRPDRLHSFSVNEDDIKKVSACCSVYMAGELNVPEEAEIRSSVDEYFEEVGRFIIEKNKASIGNIQRVFKIGFNRAARIMDQLCEYGVVSEETGTRPRDIYMKLDEFECLCDGLRRV